MKYISISFLYITLITSTQVFADQYYDFALQSKKNETKLIEPYKIEAINRKQYNDTFINPYKEFAVALQKQWQQSLSKNNEPIINDNNALPSVIVFVSFSMSKVSIEAYLRDAKKIHASVVIRGLVNNSFKETYLKVAELINESKGDGMQINPLWFKALNIQKVPTIAVLVNGNECLKQKNCSKDKDVDIVEGDVTLNYALRKMRDKGIVDPKKLEKMYQSLEGNVS